MDFSSLLRSNGFLSLNKVLLKHLGLDKTVFICHMLDQYEFYADQGKLCQDGSFFLAAKKWEEQTGQSEYIYSQCIKWAESHNIIKVHKHGVPMRRFFYIEQDEMEAFLKIIFEKDRYEKEEARKKEREEATTFNLPLGHMSAKAQAEVDELLGKNKQEQTEDEEEAANPVSTVGNNYLDIPSEEPKISSTIKENRDIKNLTPPIIPPLTGGDGSEKLVVESKVESVEPEQKEKGQVNPAQYGLLPESVVGSTSKPVSESVQQSLQHPVKELTHAQRTKKLGGMSKEARENLEKEADIILDWYKESGKVEDQTRRRGKDRILDRLLDGWRSDVLLLAIQRYVWSTDQAYRESLNEDNNQAVCADPTYYYGIGNFYGRDAHFLRFLDEEVDWEEKTNTPAGYELLQVNKFYRPLKAQYQEKYGDKWERELHKAKPWKEMWDNNKRDFQKMNPDGWEKDVYGDWDIPEDPDACPGNKIFARDWDENDATCMLCPSREECKCDLARFTWTKDIVVDHMSEKRLA